MYCWLFEHTTLIQFQVSKCHVEDNAALGAVRRSCANRIWKDYLHLNSFDHAYVRCVWHNELISDLMTSSQELHFDVAIFILVLSHKSNHVFDVLLGSVRSAAFAHCILVKQLTSDVSKHNWRFPTILAITEFIAESMVRIVTVFFSWFNNYCPLECVCFAVALAFAVLFVKSTAWLSSRAIEGLGNRWSDVNRMVVFSRGSQGTGRANCWSDVVRMVVFGCRSVCNI